MSKMEKTSAISRDDAIGKARELYGAMKFYHSNPTINDEEFDNAADIFDQLVTEHNISLEELEGESKVIKDLAEVPGNVSDIALDDNNPISVFLSQPEAVKEREVERANRLDRNHDDALPFKIGFNPSTGKIDEQELIKHFEQRMSEFSPSDHRDFDPEKMHELQEAYALGMDTKKYKAARGIGAPHDYLKKVFIDSIRPHTIQDDEYAGEISGGENWFSETPVGAAARDFKWFDDLLNTKEKGTEVATSSGFIPFRMSVINPFLAGKAYREGVKPEELIEAWHGNGFHPLGGVHAEFTYPIAKYIGARGMGLSHEDSKAVLRSLQYFPMQDIHALVKEGHTAKEIAGASNARFGDIELPAAPEAPFKAFTGGQ